MEFMNEASKRKEYDQLLYDSFISQTQVNIEEIQKQFKTSQPFGKRSIDGLYKFKIDNKLNQK